MKTIQINYWKQLEDLTTSVCNGIIEELKRIGKEEVTSESGFDTFYLIGSEENLVYGINNDAELMIDTTSDVYFISIYSDNIQVQDLIYILTQLQKIK